MRLAVTLRDYTWRGYAKAGEMLDFGVREHNLLAFVDHVHELLLEVRLVLGGRFVR